MKEERKEALEATVLASVGLMRGIWQEYLKPNKEAVGACLGVIATGVALGYALRDN